MRLDRLSGLLIALLALCFCPTSPAHATLVPRSGDVLLVSGFHELDLTCPALAVDLDGAAVTVWSWQNNHYRGPVWSRRVETDGTVGPEIQLSEEGELAGNPGIVATEGGYVAYWTRDALPDGPPWGTAVRLLDASGRPADAARVVDEGIQGDTRIAAVGDRLALVARSRDGGLRLRMVDLQGADVYPPRELAASYEETYSFALASDGDGVVVAWSTSEWGEGVPELKAQAFDAAGQPRSEPIIVARPGGVLSLHVATGAGRFVVGWSEPRPNGVELRVFSLAGELLGKPRLPRPTGIPILRTRYLTDLVPTPQGVMVVWNSMNRWRAREDLFVARLDWDWARTTRSTRLTADRLHRQRCGSLATNGNGDWAAAWQEIASSSAFVNNEARTFGIP